MILSQVKLFKITSLIFPMFYPARKMQMPKKELEKKMSRIEKAAKTQR